MYYLCKTNHMLKHALLFSSFFVGSFVENKRNENCLLVDACFVLVFEPRDHWLIMGMIMMILIHK